VRILFQQPCLENTTSSTVVMIIKRQSYRTLFFTPYHSSIFPTCSLTSLFWSLAVTADNVLSALIIHQFQKQTFLYVDQLKTVQSFILYWHCLDLLLTSFNGQQPWSIHTSTQTCWDYPLTKLQKLIQLKFVSPSAAQGLQPFHW
jgi:hypothetical protein